MVAASNLERNLYLTTELIDTSRSMVIALNMFDEFRESGAVLDYPLLAKMIGVPIVPTVSRTGRGLEQLFDAVIDVFEGQSDTVRHVHVTLSADVEKAVTILKDIIKSDGTIGHRESPRYLAIKLLEGAAETRRYLKEQRRCGLGHLPRRAALAAALAQPSRTAASPTHSWASPCSSASCCSRSGSASAWASIPWTGWTPAWRPSATSSATG